MANATKGKAGGVSKMDAVREALRELTSDAKPAQIQGFIKAKFGVAMTLDHISNYKSNILKKSGKGKRRGRKPGPKPGAPKAPAPDAAAGHGRRRTHLSIEEADTLRRLLREVEPGALKGMIDVLAR
jgi:hypothetical protein